MKISTRVGLGLGVVFLLSAGVLAWQWNMITRLADAQRDIAEVKLPATEAALGLLETCGLLEEHVRKFEVTRDPAYGAAARIQALELDKGISRLAELEEAGTGVAGLEALVSAWSSSSLFELEEADVSAGGSSPWGTTTNLSPVRREIEGLRRDVRRVLDGTRRDTSTSVAGAASSTVRAQNVSGAALFLVLVLCAAVILVTIHSIRRPLRRLLEATHAVAAGRLDHRVESSSGTELAELARRFNSMAERLAEVDRAKREFFSNVSHEIKTPLAAMQESTRLLLDEVPGELSDKQRRLIGLQAQCQDRLQRMIGDLLDLSRMDAGVFRYQFAELNLGVVVSEAVDVLEVSAAKRGVRLLRRLDGVERDVRCDPHRLGQVVHNVVENALRHSPEGGVVTVALECPRPSRDRDATARVTVSDQGPGVPDEHKTKVFERFHQVPTTGSAAAPKSVGLGLTICNRIVAAHGGSIWVEDCPDGGAAFVFELPIGGPPATPIEADLEG